MDWKPSVLYEDNHFIIINKRGGELVQGDSTGDAPLSELLASYIGKRDGKSGDAFIGVAHRVDRPVSGALLFAKTSKGLTRINKLFKEGKVERDYLAFVPTSSFKLAKLEGELLHYLRKRGDINRSHAHQSPGSGRKEGRLKYKVLGATQNYTLLEINLLTGRHHQIRAQLSAIGSPIKGDLKYGSRRSNGDGSISLHARRLAFVHPIRGEFIEVIAPAPDDSLWNYFNL